MYGDGDRGKRKVSSRAEQGRAGQKAKVEYWTGRHSVESLCRPDPFRSGPHRDPLTMGEAGRGFNLPEITFFSHNSIKAGDRRGSPARRSGKARKKNAFLSNGLGHVHHGARQRVSGHSSRVFYSY